jgi:hypothetical protein
MPGKRSTRNSLRAKAARVDQRKKRSFSRVDGDELGRPSSCTMRMIARLGYAGDGKAHSTNNAFRRKKLLTAEGAENGRGDRGEERRDRITGKLPD